FLCDLRQRANAEVFRRSASLYRVARFRVGLCLYGTRQGAERATPAAECRGVPGGAAGDPVARVIVTDDLRRDASGQIAGRGGPTLARFLWRRAGPPLVPHPLGMVEASSPGEYGHRMARSRVACRSRAT